MRQLAERNASGLRGRDHRVGTLVPDLAFEDLAGRAGKLSDYAGQAALVVVVRQLDDPEAELIAPETAALEQELLAQDVAFLYVNPGPLERADEMRAEASSFGFQGRYVADPEQRILGALGATHGTDFFLLDARRSLIYRGALAAPMGGGARDAPGRGEHLLDALRALQVGQRPRLEASLSSGRPLERVEQPAAASLPVPTYHNAVSRLIQQNCESCHRPGGAGPFALDSFKKLKRRASMVRFVLEEKTMPPWLASEDSLPFRGDKRLSEAELQTFFDWQDAGMPEGDPADAPLARTWHGEWQIGAPDHVFEDQEPFLVPAEGVVDLITTHMDVELSEDIWVDRIQVSASAPEVVHHSSVLLRFPEGHANESQAGLRRGEDGFQWRFFMAYLPGAGSRIYGEGMGRLVPKGSVLRVVTHYTTNGVETPNRMRIGMLEAEAKPEFVVETRMLRRHDIVIPPGAADVRFDQEFTLPKDVLLFSVTPHMHLRGKRYVAVLVQPDGAREKLIEIPRWDSNWQFSYVLEEMRLLPKDARIQYAVWYDNSANNAANPDPLQTVTDGPQIWDEMMQMWIEWVRPRAEGE